MVIVFDTERAKGTRVTLSAKALAGIPAELRSDEILERAGARVTKSGISLPLSSIRFVSESDAAKYAAKAGVEERAVSSFFHFNTKALKRRTIPAGANFVTLFGNKVTKGYTYNPRSGGYDGRPAPVAPVKRASKRGKRAK